MELHQRDFVRAAILAAGLANICHYTLLAIFVMAKIFYTTSVIKWPKMSLLFFHQLTCGKQMLHVFGIAHVTLARLLAANYAGKNIQCILVDIYICMPVYACC